MQRWLRSWKNHELITVGQGIIHIFKARNSLIYGFIIDIVYAGSAIYWVSKAASRNLAEPVGLWRRVLEMNHGTKS